MSPCPTEDDQQVLDYDGKELNGTGRRNAKHAEEIHDEIVKTIQVMRRFLKEQLTTIHPGNWKEACVDAAFEAFVSEEFRPFLPKHYDIELYDIRALSAVMEYNLFELVFVRGTEVTSSEIRTVLFIRNIYEHNSPHLNNRNWSKDIKTIRCFRAKMETDEEMAGESYDAADLPQMEADSAEYLSELDKLQHQIEAVTNTVFGLDKRIKDNAQVDEEQSAELHRQKEADKEQFEELDRQQEADREHDASIDFNARNIAWLTYRDSIQKKAIIALVCVNIMSLCVSMAALLRKR